MRDVVQSDPRGTCFTGTRCANNLEEGLIGTSCEVLDELSHLTQLSLSANEVVSCIDVAL